MSQELLQQLLDMASSAGEGSFTLIVLYLLIPPVQTVLIIMALLYVSLRVAKIILCAHKAHSVIANALGDSNWHYREQSEDYIVKRLKQHYSDD